MVADGLIRAAYVPTTEMLADSLTKPLRKEFHKDHWLHLHVTDRPGHETRCPGTLSRDYETRRPGTLWKKSRDVSRLRGKCPGTSRDFCENFQCTDKVL